MNDEELREAFADFAVRDIEGAVTFITALFVGIYEVYCEIRGGDSNKTIRISGPGEERAITIHADKRHMH